MWDVMELSSDFDGAQLPDDTNTVPVFSVVQSIGVFRVVLVLDTSGSMKVS